MKHCAKFTGKSSRVRSAELGYAQTNLSTLTITQELAEPNPLRLKWRELIKSTIREVVLHTNRDAFEIIQNTVQANVEVQHQAEIQTLIIEELRRIHEGVLARYGLRPSEYRARVKYKTYSVAHSSTAKPGTR